MIIEPAPELREAALNALRAEYQMDEQRPGMHQSELGYCLTKSYWRRVDPLPPTDREVGLWAIGFSMERVLLSRETTPEPLVVDGITLSLDTIDLFGPADLKTTRMSPEGKSGGCAICGEVRKDHSKDHKYEAGEKTGFEFPDGWKKQFAAYCYGMGIESFGVIVVHLIQPEVTAWRITFTHNELVANWEWMLDRSNHLESMLAAGDPQPFRHNEDWECKSCVYYTRCGLEASLRRFAIE